MKSALKKLIALILLPLIFCSCAQKTDKQKPTVVATLFPQYDFCRWILKDDANVVLLLPAGMESHNYQPSVNDIRIASDADLFVFTGASMEPWAEKIAQNAKNTVDASTGIELCEHEHEGEHDGHHHESDPHVWTSPYYAQKMVENILQGIIELDSANADKYTARAEEYISKLKKLDQDFFAVCENKQDVLLCHGGRFSLTYFAKRYNLNFVAAFDSCSSHAEPSAKKIASLTDILKEQTKRFVFYEELIEPKIAKTISDETGAEMLLLHSCHNVSKKELDAGVTYLSLMQQNLQNLKKVFGE